MKIQLKQAIKIIVICTGLIVVNTSFAACSINGLFSTHCPPSTTPNSASTQVPSVEKTVGEVDQTNSVNQVVTASIPCGTKAAWRQGFCLMGYDKSKLTREQLRTKRIMWALVGGGAVLTVGAACVLSGVCEAIAIAGAGEADAIAEEAIEVARAGEAAGEADAIAEEAREVAREAAREAARVAREKVRMNCIFLGGAMVVIPATAYFCLKNPQGVLDQEALDVIKNQGKTASDMLEKIIQEAKNNGIDLEI